MDVAASSNGLPATGQAAYGPKAAELLERNERRVSGSRKFHARTEIGSEAE